MNHLIQKQKKNKQAKRNQNDRIIQDKSSIKWVRKQNKWVSKQNRQTPAWKIKNKDRVGTKNTEGCNICTMDY